MAQQNPQKHLKKNSKIAVQYVHLNSFFPNFFYKFAHWRLLRLYKVKKVSNDWSGINFHYSGSQKSLIFVYNVIKSWKIVGLKCLKTSPMTL